MDDGRFACGRVMAVPAFGERDRVGFVAGRMDWVGSRPPVSDDLAGRSVLAQAHTRYEAISKTGGAVLGLRPLAADGLVAVDPSDLRVGATQLVWGWATIKTRAQRAFS
jgi:hypothetical protein